MSYFLHNPNLAWLFPLIAVPVLLHYLARAKPPRYLFSTTLFIKKVVQQTFRFKRPKDRLLLICRTLLFVALFVLFLRPVLFLNGQLPGQDLPGSLVIVIDRSASMSWSEAGRSRFTAACDEASVLLDQLSSRDKANIVWLDREPEAVFPEMGANVSFLRDRLRQARCTHESGNTQQAIKLAVSQLQAQSGARELCIISDFQATQWENRPIDVPADITVSTLRPVRDAAENSAVLSIRTEPLSPLVGESTTVIFSIGNFSGTPRNQTVMLTIDEKRMSRQVQTPAWGHGTVMVEHVFSKPGQATVSARLEEDAFGMDDWQGTLVPVRDTIHVGVAGDDPHTASVFRRACRSLPWMAASRIDADSMTDTDEYDLVILPGWNGRDVESAAQIRAQGVPLVVSPAPGLSFAALAQLTGSAAPAQDKRVFMEAMDKAMGLSIKKETHKAFALFRDGAFGDPSKAAFNKRFRLDEAQRLGETLLSYSDGKPALVECRGAPTVLLWLAPLAPDCSDWAAQVPFLPFFGELMGSIRGTKQIHLPQIGLPGEILSFQTEAAFDEGRLVDQADRVYPVTRVDTSDAGTRFVSGPIEAPGIYRLCRKDGCTAVKMVNFPSSESDLRTTRPPAINQSADGVLRHAAEINAQRQGVALWKILVWAAIAFVGLESLLVLLLDVDEQKMAKGSL